MVSFYVFAEYTESNFKVKRNHSKNVLESKVDMTEAIVWRCSVKKMFLKILRNSREIICIRVTFLIKLFIKKNPLRRRCFSVNFAKFLGTPFFKEHF